METQTITGKPSFAEKFSDSLKKAKQEIEELTVQFALGKADATDKFEEIKRDFNAKVHEWKQAYSKVKSIGMEKSIKLKTKFEELHLQLELGRADARDLFDEQKEKILLAVLKLEVEIRENPDLNEYLSEFRTEVEKFKLKLEILKLKFELKKFEMKDQFKDEMRNAGKEIDKLFTRVEVKWDKAKSKFTDFNDEIDLAFKHLKKAVKSL